MDLGLSNRTIFIAGASKGIGRGIAEICLQEGARVALTARGLDGLRQTEQELKAVHGPDRVWTMAGDMRKTVDVETALERCEEEFGPLDGLVANVGIHPCPLGFDVDDETWEGGLQQNLGANYRLARGALRRMSRRQQGAIVLVSSIAGVDILGSPLTYGTAKAALNHLGGELARLAGPMGVRVNTIAPGNVLFPGGEWEARINGPRSEAWQRWIRREVPLARFGTPEEIGRVVAFALSPAASFMTGALLVVDGGQTR